MTGDQYGNHVDQEIHVPVHYPENEKLGARGVAEIREFAGWLFDHGLLDRNPEELVFQFVGINPAELERERRDILARLRKGMDSD